MITKARVMATASGGYFGGGVYEVEVTLYDKTKRRLFINKYPLRNLAKGTRGFSVSKVKNYLKTEEGLKFLEDYIAGGKINV